MNNQAIIQGLLPIVQQSLEKTSPLKYRIYTVYGKKTGDLFVDSILQYDPNLPMVVLKKLITDYTESKSFTGTIMYDKERALFLFEGKRKVITEVPVKLTKFIISEDIYWDSISINLFPYSKSTTALSIRPEHKNGIATSKEKHRRFLNRLHDKIIDEYRNTLKNHKGKVIADQIGVTKALSETYTKKSTRYLDLEIPVSVYYHVQTTEEYTLQELLDHQLSIIQDA